MELMPGTRVKNYTLERQLGKGASGEVWRAYDETKTVAIKFMNENLMKSASAAKHRERLIREVESLQRLQHPNIPSLYDYDLDFVRPYLAMRYVGGDSYDRLISTGEMLKIPLQRRLEAIRELAFALTAAHDAGIIHRDIKPANMTGIENPFLLDFSISLGKAQAESTQRFVGTTLYMAPDGVVDRLSDNYSFAVVVYEILFGRHPIYQLGDSVFNQFIADMRLQNRQWNFPSTVPTAQLPPDLRNADLRGLDVIFERAFGPREQRYTNLREFVRDLQNALHLAPMNSQIGEAPPQQQSVPPIQHVSQPPPAYVSQAPAAPPEVPLAQTKPEPEEVVEAEAPPSDTDFSEKAFFNLPAVQRPPEIEITSVEHGTVPYDYGTHERKPVDAPKVQVDRGTGLGDPEIEEDAEADSGFAEPEAMTMMEIRIPKQPEPEPEPVDDYAGPEDGTRMEIPIPKPPKPAPEPEPANQFDRTMPEIRIPKQPEPEPEPANAFDRTMPEIRIPQAAESAPPDMDRTIPDIRVPTKPDMDRTIPDLPVPQTYASSYPQQGDNFTMMEMQIPQQPYASQQGENFTMMEMQAASSQSMRTARDPFADIDLDKTNLKDRLTDPKNRILVIIAAIIIALVVIAVIVALLSSGARVS